MTYIASATFPNGWLNFELSVLRHMKFSSIALPFTGEPNLGAQLKRWKVRVAANDPMNWSFTKATALIENDSERLTAEEIESIVDDAYVPRERLDNSSLLHCFNETDAWWFHNVRFNSERLETDYKRALALTLGLLVGDRKSTRLNSSHVKISYAVFCLKKKKKKNKNKTLTKKKKYENKKN